MKSMNLLEEVVFGDEMPNAQPLLVDANIRILRFTLQPGQEIKEHASPSSPLYMIVVEGRGEFSGEDGKRKEFGPNSMLVFDKSEKHSIKALDENLIFVAILREVSSSIPLHKSGGLLGRADA